MSKRLLLAGETWISYGVHLKGFSSYTTGGYDEGQKPLVEALTAAGWEVDHIPNHLATEQFPWTLDALDAYDVVVLSDISADTLLLHPRAFVKGQRIVDRLELLAEWVRRGGGFAMIGGYMAFSGFEGRGRFGMTSLADILPVRTIIGDDRIEKPAGVTPVVSAEHDVLSGLSTDWPHFLGYNRVIAREEATTLMTVGDDPFLVVAEFGEGRAAAFASDCSPHWGSPEFLAWKDYQPFWNQLMSWLARK